MRLLENPATCAFLAARAEGMFVNDLRFPPALPPDVSTSWTSIGSLYARNALFDTQRIGLGDPVWYGFVAKQIGEVIDNYIVVVRGTHLPIEWAEDCQILLVPHPVAGFVHQGFWSIYRTMTYSETSAARAIAEMIKADGTKPCAVTFMGHSLGGPLATYLARDVAEAVRAAGFTRRVLVEAALFASPRAGDFGFAHHFDETIRSDHYTVWNYTRDRVPQLPPRLPLPVGYQDLLHTVWITPAQGKAKIPDDVASNHDAMNYAALLGYTASAAPTPTGVSL